MRYVSTEEPLPFELAILKARSMMEQVAVQRNRNLFLFGLMIICLLIGGIWVHRNQQKEELAAVASLAISKMQASVSAPRTDGNHPCVFASGNTVVSLGRCGMLTDPIGSVDQFEVDLRYGTFVLHQRDMHLNDIFDVPFTRSYNSGDWLAHNRVHAFGIDSNHSYDIAPVGTRNPYSHMMLVLGDGDFLYFERVLKGTGFADAVYQHTETSTRFYKSTIAWNGNGWTLRLIDGSEMLFPEAYYSKNMAQGAATEIRDAAGNKLDLKRDGQRNLKEILTPHGHWIRFTYDGLSRITQAEDDGGNWVKYEYNSYGMLIYANYSSGQERHYEYQGSLMIAITDEHWKVLVRNWYEGGLLIRQRYADGGVYQYSYSLNNKRTYAVQVVITLPDGSSRTVSVADAVPEYLRIQ